MNHPRFGTLPFVAVYLSLAILLLQFLLASIVRRHKMESRYPAFSAFAYTMLAKGIVVFLIARLGTNAAYTRAYYFSATVSSILVAMCAVEVYFKVFGPRIALPVWAFRNTVILMPAAMVSALIVAGVFRSLQGDLAARALWTAQQAIFAIVLAVLGMMLLYSRHLGIAWPLRVAGIGWGFVLMMSVSFVSSVVIGRGGHVAAMVAAFATQSVNGITFAWWVWRFWEKEPERIPATREQVEKLQRYLEGAMLPIGAPEAR